MLLLDGTAGRWKGGPSIQNEAEFKRCIEKLQNASVRGITDKFLVLVYRCGTIKPKGRHSYEKSYADLGRFGITSVRTVEHCDAQCVACKLIRVE